MPIATSWTGPIDRSLSGLPFFGRLDGRDDLLYGLGFSGNGVGPTSVGGRILASLALGTKDEWSECGLVRDGVGLFPREPVRYVGGRMVIAANRRKERLEDEGRTPGPLDGQARRPRACRPRAGQGGRCAGSEGLRRDQRSLRRS